MSRDYVTALLILVILLAGLYALNVYLVQPSLTPKFDGVSSQPYSDSDAARPSGKVQKIVATTLEKINTMFPQKEYSKEFEPRQVTRNPFFWPHEAISPEQLRAEYERGLEDTREAEEVGTRLKMVILGENKKIALINNQILFEGSAFGADTVKNIYEKEVVLSGPSGETHLMMARAMPYSPEPGIDADAGVRKPMPAQEESAESLFNKLKPFLEKGQQEELEKIRKTQQK